MGKATQPKTPLTIEWMRLDELESRVDAANPKDHDIGTLLQSFAEFGFIDPVALNEKTGKVIAGHGRIKSVRVAFDDGQDPPENVWDDGEIWWMLVIRGISLTPVKGKAYLIAGNQGDLAGWDEPKKLALLTELAKARRLKGTGYDGDDVDRLAQVLRISQKQKDTRPDVGKARAQALVKKWKVEPGQLWQIGEHRLLIDDSTLKKSWTRLMAGQHARMVFTDPPYGISYEDRLGKFAQMEGDDKRRDQLVKVWTRSLKHMADNSIERAAFYIWHAWETYEDFIFSVKAAGLLGRQLLIWAKSGIVLDWNHYLWSHEPLLYAGKAGSKMPEFFGDRGQATVWRVKHGQANGSEVVALGTGLILTDGQGNELAVSARIPKKKQRHFRLTEGDELTLQASPEFNTVWEASSVLRSKDRWHPTEKPIVLAERAIRNSSKLGELVVDGFLGSGTTMIAAEQAGRRCNAMELEPEYAASTLERMAELGIKGKQE